MSKAVSKTVLMAMAALVAASFLAGCGKSSVAKVNGRKISRQEYYDRLERMPMGNPPMQVEAGVVVLRDLINEELLIRLAEKEKVPPTNAQVDERYKQMEKQPQFMAKMKESGLTKDQAKDLVRILQAHFNLMTRGIKVTDEEVKKYYEANKDKQFTIPENAEVAAIFCENKATADKAMNLLKQNVDFATVAKQLSSDPNSKDRGGRLGRPVYVNDQGLPEAVWKKVLATKKGAYTEPIADQTGFVIFKVIRQNPKKVQKFEEVKFLLWDGMMREKGGQKWNVDAELNKFRETADVKIMIDRYRDQLLPKEGGPGIPGGQKQETKQQPK
ncbi:MAG: peptidyl-prolyl cis-trans isomerase [Armatimonadetes bacterium]|nr:peptidyl-prolyl cis-trans isomerase [Armatimonadota bacterium]